MVARMTKRRVRCQPWEEPEAETVEQLGHELLAFRAWVIARVLSHQPGLVGVARPGRADRARAPLPVRTAAWLMCLGAVLTSRVSWQGSRSSCGKTRLIHLNLTHADMGI